MRTWVILALVVGTFSSLPAQSPPPREAPLVLPAGPLLKRAPEYSQWTINTKFADEKTNPGEKPVVDPRSTQTVVTKAGQNYRLLSVDGIGRRTQIWIVDELQIAIFSNARLPVVSARNTDEDAIDFSKQDFAGFAWISARNFVGMQKVEGNDCLIFKDKVKLTADPDPIEGLRKSTAVSDAKAIIDEKTRLPVMLQAGETTTTYQFGPPPTTPLAPPADVQELINAWRKQRQRASMVPPP